MAKRFNFPHHNEVIKICFYLLQRIRIYLVAAFIKCKIVDEEGNKTQQAEIIVKPMKEFEDKSHLLIARSLNDMVDDVLVRVLNSTLEQWNVYKNTTIACAKNSETILRIQQNNPDNNTKSR